MRKRERLLALLLSTALCMGMAGCAQEEKRTENSGSGQAALTMPIMAPLSDLVGVSRQTSVLAFQLGDAFSNLIVPTSGCLLGTLGVAKLEWGKWAKFQIKMQGVLFVSASIVMIIAVLIHF